MPTDRLYTMSDSVQSNMFGNASASSAVTSDAPAARRPVDTARLKVVPSPHAKLSPAQQRFNKLLSRVDNLGRQVEDFQRLADQVRGPHLASMSEMHREMAAGQRQMLVFLHDN